MAEMESLSSLSSSCEDTEKMELIKAKLKVETELYQTKIDLMKENLEFIKEKRIRKMFTSGLITYNHAAMKLNLPLLKDGDSIRFGDLKVKCHWEKLEENEMEIK